MTPIMFVPVTLKGESHLRNHKREQDHVNIELMLSDDRSASNSNEPSHIYGRRYV